MSKNIFSQIIFKGALILFSGVFLIPKAYSMQTEGVELLEEKNENKIKKESTKITVKEDKGEIYASMENNYSGYEIVTVKKNKETGNYSIDSYICGGRRCFHDTEWEYFDYGFVKDGSRQVEELKGLIAKFEQTKKERVSQLEAMSGNSEGK